MRNDLDELKENETQLDNLIEKLKTSNNVQSENKLAYVTCQDLHSIDMYKEQMIMVVKAPPESQLILMGGNPPPVVLKSEKEEIDIFFCPDPSELHSATATLESTDDEEPSSSTRPHRKAASSTASANKRRNLGSAQRNLSKAFEEMKKPKTAKSKSLFHAFNATICRELSDDGINTNEDTEEEDDITPRKTFKSTTITTKDLMLLNDPSGEDFESPLNIKKDVKLSLFTPQKNLQSHGESAWAELPELSPSYSFSHSDGFFPLEPEAEYNFLLAETEGIMDLFDYNI